MSTTLGANIVLGGEKQFAQAIRNTTANLKTLDSELKLLQAEFSANEKSEEALAKKQDVLNRKIDEQNKKIQLLTSGLERSNEKRKKAAENIEKYKRQLEAAQNAESQDAEAIKKTQELLEKEQAAYNRAETAIANYQTKINNAKADLIAYQDQLKETTDELNSQNDRVSSFTANLDAVSGKLKNIGDGITNAGKTLSLGVTDPVMGALGASVKSGMSYEQSLSQVQATMALDKTSAEMEKLKNAASEMGEQTQFSASQAAEALNYLALAGYNADEAVGTLPSVLNAALAGSMDLGTASDMITDAMSALGLSVDDADEFIDKMAVTSSRANTSVAQLGEAILTVGGTAKDLKGGVTELDAELGLLANTGIKAAEGGTHLRNIILSLQENSKKLKDFGVEVYDANGKMNSLNDIFVQLRESMQGFTDEQKSARIDEIFKLTDLAAAKSLLSQAGDAFDELSASISDSDGAAQRMADTMADNFSGSIKELQSKLESLQNEAFEIMLPVINDIVGGLKNFVDWLKGLDDETKKNIISTAAFAAALGPVLVALGSIISTIGTVAGALTGLSPAMLPVIAALAGVAGGVALANAVMNEANSTIVELSQEYYKLQGHISSLRDEYDKEIKANEETAIAKKADLDQVLSLITGYENLANKVNRTTAEEEEYKKIVDTLNELVPDFNNYIDAQNGLISVNTQELEKNILAQKALAEVEEKRANLSSAVEYKIEVGTEYERKKAQLEAKGLTEKEINAISNMNVEEQTEGSGGDNSKNKSSIEILAEKYGEDIAVLNQLSKSYDYAKGKVKEAEKELEDAQKSYDNKKNKLDSSSAKNDSNTTEKEEAERQKQAAEKEAKEAQKAAEKEAKEAQKAAGKEAEAARKAAEKEEKERQKQAEKDAKEAEAEAKKEAEAEAKARLEAYQKEQSRSKKWIGYRNLYDDFDKYGTTEGDSYGRIMERAGKAYQDGILDYKSYVSAISSLTSDMADKEITFYEKIFAYLKEQYAQGLLSYEDYIEQFNDVSALAYKAQEKMVKETQATQKSNIEKMYDAELARQKARIDQVQSAIDKEMESLRTKWDRDDRQRDLAELYKEADKYRKSVTITGQEHYQEIEKQIESLEREEQMAQLEERQAAIMEQLQKEYDAVEARKNALLASIAENNKNYQIDMTSGIENMNFLLGNIKEALSTIIPNNNVTYNYITDNRTTDNQNHSTYTYNNNIADNVDLMLLNKTIYPDRLNT